MAPVSTSHPTLSPKSLQPRGFTSLPPAYDAYKKKICHFSPVLSWMALVSLDPLLFGPLFFLFLSSSSLLSLLSSPSSVWIFQMPLAVPPPTYNKILSSTLPWSSHVLISFKQELSTSLTNLDCCPLEIDCVFGYHCTAWLSNFPRKFNIN